MPSVILNAGPKLIPFFLTLAIYFLVFIPHTNPGWFAALLKCLPITCLMIFVQWYGKHIEKEYKSFVDRIFYGLLFSCLGDFSLIWPEYFVFGMILFAIGHINYIIAFGFEPFNLPVAIVSYTLSFLGCIYLMPDLHDILIPGVPIYSIILGTMMWRAIARLEFKKNLWTWCRICTTIGAVSFVISDLLIGLHKFKFEIPQDQALIMSTYYAAQFGIALSIVDINKKKKN